MRLPFQQVVTKTKGGFKRFWKWLRKQMEEWLIIKPVKALYMGIVYCAYKVAVEKALPAEISKTNRDAIADALIDMLNSGDLEDRIKKNEKLKKDVEFLERQLGEFLDDDKETKEVVEKIMKQIQETAAEEPKEEDKEKEGEQEFLKERELRGLFGKLLGEKLQKKVQDGTIAPEKAVEIQTNIEETLGRITQELEGIEQESARAIVDKVMATQHEANGHKHELDTAEETDTKRVVVETPTPRARRKGKDR